MKSISLALGLATAWVAASSGADQTTVTNATKPLPANKKVLVQTASTKTNQAYLTGSYIKRDIRRNGQITDGPNSVLVIDSKTIKTSGAADLRQLLVRQGASR